MPHSDDHSQQTVFERMVVKLLEYNEKMNGGKEISVIDYFKRIDQKSPFIQRYENQRHLRRVFHEEFKIQSFNYILLLFEGVVRLLTTLNKDDNEGEDANIDLRKGRKVRGPNNEEQ